jgi:xanthine dehydrogenase/oxidase
LDDGHITIGAGETFASVISYLENAEELLSSDEGKTARVLLRILKNLATAQLRNVATLGGTIMWGHPASDILPLLRVCGASLVVVDTDLQKRNVDVDRGFNKDKIRKGDIITQINIPKTNTNQTIFFEKQARRKTADLAVANIAIFAEFSSEKMSLVRVSMGGVEAAIKECKDESVPCAQQLANLLVNKNAADISRQMIEEAVLHDLSVCGKKISQYKAGVYRSFVLKFLDNLKSENTSEKRISTIRAHQLYQKIPPSLPEIDPVTRPIAHVSSAQQCTGEAKFVDDMPKLAHELYLYPVQSTEAHANFTIENLDKALAYPGVVSWISHKDIPPERNLWSASETPDEEVFPISEVLHYGQVIGLIAAESKEAARAAAALVKVSYKKLEAIVTLDHAVKAGEKTIMGSAITFERYQDKASTKQAEFKLSGIISAAGQEHFYMEPHSALVVPSGEKEELTIYFTTQEPSSVQATVASVLGLPQNRIIVKCKRTGGAFGGKEKSIVAIMTAVAANKLGQPCRLILPRKVDIEITGHRHEIKSSYACGFTKEGKIEEANFETNYNAGFSMDLSALWGMILNMRIDGGYTLKNLRASAIPRRTNLVSNTAFRGFGGPEGALIVEDAIERIAEFLHVDPLEVRRQNITRIGDQLHYGSSTVQDDHILRCFEECLQMSNYEEHRKAIIAFNADPKNQQKRQGIAIVPMKFAPFVPVKSFNQGSAFVRIYKDGTVLLSHGGIEMGQGLHTKMLQVAAKVLRVSLDKFHLNDTSTETIPNAPPTGGSTGTDINGHAVRIACEKLRSRLDAFHKQHPEIQSWEELICKANLGRVQLAEYGFYNTSSLEYDIEANSGEVFHYLTSGAGCVVVEVDCLTGNHTILRTDIVMDVGESINPAIDIGQIEGAFVQGNLNILHLISLRNLRQNLKFQGYGYVTMEEMLHGSAGEILTNNLG